MENIPHIHYLALRGTPKEKMIEVVILNSFFPAVFDINIKSFADGAEDKNCFKIYEITWNIVPFLRDIRSTFEIFKPLSRYSIYRRDIQSTFEHYTAYTNPTSSHKYETSRLGEYHKYPSLPIVLHVLEISSFLHKFLTALNTFLPVTTIFFFTDLLKSRTTDVHVISLAK